MTGAEPAGVAQVAQGGEVVPVQGRDEEAEGVADQRGQRERPDAPGPGGNKDVVPENGYHRCGTAAVRVVYVVNNSRRQFGQQAGFRQVEVALPGV